MNEGRRYKILGILGKGGFGTVYRAELLGEGGFTRAVALKVLNPDVEGITDVARRLRDEARLLGMLRHRAILQVDGLVKLDDRWTVVMEYVEGSDIGKIIGKLGPLPAGPALEILGEAASALSVAYSRPGPSGEPLCLLHRDIKPQNIMVTPAGEVKVLDFGIARAEFDQREAQTRSVMFGSIGYMAPERFELEERAEGDVYSLGVVLYEMLSGEAYGKATLHPQKFIDRMNAGLATLRALPAPPPANIVELLQLMMSYDPNDRPSARDVERICRDLRGQVRGPWLRDWAEDAIPPLIDLALDPHDFSSDVVSEYSAMSSVTGGFDLGAPDDEPPALPPPFSQEEAPPPPPLPPPPPPPRPPVVQPAPPPLPPPLLPPPPLVEAPPVQVIERPRATMQRSGPQPDLPELRVRRRRRSGGGMFQTFAITSGILTTIAVLVGMASFLMVFLTCCGMCAGGG